MKFCLLRVQIYFSYVCSWRIFRTPNRNAINQKSLNAEATQQQKRKIPRLAHYQGCYSIDYTNPFTDTAPNVKLLVLFKILSITLLTSYLTYFRFFSNHNINNSICEAVTPSTTQVRSNSHYPITTRCLRFSMHPNHRLILITSSSSPTQEHVHETYGPQSIIIGVWRKQRMRYGCNPRYKRGTCEEWRFSASTG